MAWVHSAGHISQRILFKFCMEMYLGIIYTSLLFGDAALIVPSFIGSKVIFPFLALLLLHFSTDFVQILHEGVPWCNLKICTFWWCCHQCPVFYRVKGHTSRDGVSSLCRPHFLMDFFQILYGDVSWYISQHISFKFYMKMCLSETYTSNFYTILLFEGGDGGGSLSLLQIAASAGGYISHCAAMDISSYPRRWNRQGYVKGSVCLFVCSESDRKESIRFWWWLVDPCKFCVTLNFWPCSKV